MRWPRTMFGRITLVIATVAFVFQVFAVAAIFVFVLLPQGRFAGEQLARVMVSSANAWAAQADDDKAGYASQVWQAQAIQLRAGGEGGEPLSKWLPIHHFLETAIRQRSNSASPLYSSDDHGGKTWVWVDIPTPQGKVSAGFDRAIHPQYPPLLIAIMLILGGGAVAALAVSAYLADNLTRPLRNLSRAVRCMGSGRQPDPLPEDGPEEFIHCVRSFNRMTAQVQDLLAARTTLLAGISHDLRTPLARMRLSLALLSDKHDPVLAERLIADVDSMNLLIERCLEIGHGFEEATSEVDVVALIKNAAAAAGLAPTFTESSMAHCSVRVRPLALKRILSNLLDNAVKYAGAQGIDVACYESEICLMDRGQGIPDDQLEAVFRPFFRLEPSRCQSTGGSGLGLAIAKQLADANGWALTLVNRPQGGICACLKLSRHSESPR